MKTVIRRTTEITVDELVGKLINGEKLIVFYRSNNKKDEVPVIFRFDRNEAAFYHPYAYVYKPTYAVRMTSERGLADMIGKSLANALESRKLYVLTKEESNQLFKIQN